MLHTKHTGEGDHSLISHRQASVFVPEIIIEAAVHPGFVSQCGGHPLQCRQSASFSESPPCLVIRLEIEIPCY